MKIEDNRIGKDVTFGELSIGDCFIYQDAVYIRIDEVYALGNVFDVVRNGKYTLDDGDAVVTPVNAKVVIE